MTGIRSSSRPWLLFFLTLYLVSAIVYCACPIGWQGKSDACFKVYNTMETWSEANRTCSEEKGGHLIYFNNGRTEDFVNSFKDIQHSNEYFVGADKLLGGWHWGNGAPVSSSSSLLSVLHGIYAVLRKWDLTWYAVGENHRNNFICEVKETLNPGVAVSSWSVLSSSLSSSSSSSSISSLSSSSSLTSSTPPLSTSAAALLSTASTTLSSSSSPSSSTTSTSSTPPLSTSAAALLFTASTTSSSPPPPSSSSTTSTSSTPLLSTSAAALLSTASTTSLSSSFLAMFSRASILSTPPIASPSPSPPSSLSSSSTTSSSLMLLSMSSRASLLSTSTLSSSLVSSSSIPNVLSSSSTPLVLPTAPLSTNTASSSSVSSGSQERNESQPMDNNLVSIYIRNITKLNARQSFSLKNSVDMMQNMLVAMETSSTDFTNLRPLLASQKLEEFALRFMEHNLREKEIVIKRSKIVLHAKRVFPGNSDYLFETDDHEPHQDTKILLPEENFVENGTSVVSIYYNNLEDIMNKQNYDFENERYIVRSKILSTSIQPKKNRLVKNVLIRFKFPTSDTRLKRKCVFWDFLTENADEPGWSSEGCTMAKSTDRYVECSCNHLTHFAVLMQVKDEQLSSDHQDTLAILSYLGLTVSILGCVITFLTYFLFTDVKSEQSQIRMNLVFVLAVAYILFLLGSPARDHLILCISVAALMQLFYTSALCWMFAEGIQLYMQVIKVFNTNLNMRLVYGFAWGFPLLLISVSLSISASNQDGLASFVNEEFCWLSTNNHVIWAFIAPVLLLILGNMIILCLVMAEMKKITKPMASGQRAIALKSNFKAFVVLAPLLGITWIIGLLCILGAGVVGLYVFTILNSSQGFFIFLFHCYRNSESGI